jgi:exodeoxyribonuclease VII small subunit
MCPAHEDDDDRDSVDAEAGEPSFEDALHQLSEIVGGLESGSLGLTESIAAYERGVSLLRRLHAELAVAEKRVQVLVRIGDDGQPVLADLEVGADTPGSPRASPGEPAPSVGSTAPSSRPARKPRTPRARSLPGMDVAPDEA